MWFLLEISLKLLGYLMLTLLLVLLAKSAGIYFNPKKFLMHVPGPVPLPLLGNGLLFLGPMEVYMTRMRELAKEYGPVYRVYMGTRPMLIVSSAEAFEKMVTKNAHISKAADYEFLWKWLGFGLLTSTGTKWHSRRKLLTPTFHFKILDSFMDIFNEQGNILAEIYAKQVDKPAFDIVPAIFRCSLDIICETSMGVKLNIQESQRHQDYIDALKRCAEIVLQRQSSPWLRDDWFFDITPAGREFKKSVKILQEFTENVIKLRKQELLDDADVTVERSSTKKTFLDLLLSYSQDGTVLSDKDIQEEVDTFMFEGHDTTASSISFTLYLLARHPEIQAKVQQELDEIFGGEEKPVTSEDLTRMKYLEKCLKESLRMLGSVPMIGRNTGEEVEISGYKIPKGTDVMMLIYLLHENAEVFPDPFQYDPERFSGTAKDRNAYSFLPFSAGSRNCIGQKFAMMEEKVIIAILLRKFTLKSVMKREDLILRNELVLRSKNGLHLSFQRR